MKKYIVGLVTVALLFSGCTLLESVFGQDQVLTTTSQLTEQGKGKGKIIDPEKLPEKIKESFNEHFPGEVIVLIDGAFVKEEGARIPITQKGDDFWGSFVTTAVKVGGWFWPPLLALEGVAVALFRRKRQHYGDALKKLLPINGKFEVSDAMKSFGKALGMAHSSKDSEKVFEEEIATKT